MANGPRGPSTSVEHPQGNFSHRLYETFICGRIPIFVNTDCVLPFDGLTHSPGIDWKRYMVWCEESEVHAIGDIVADFHARLTPEAFLELQRDGRRLWEELCIARPHREMHPFRRSGCQTF